MTQVCLNITNAAFLYTDLEISIYLSVYKLNTSGPKFEIWTEFWTEFPILDWRKMTFWKACLFSSYIWQVTSY